MPPVTVEHDAVLALAARLRSSAAGIPPSAARDALSEAGAAAPGGALASAALDAAAAAGVRLEALRGHLARLGELSAAAWDGYAAAERAATAGRAAPSSGGAA